MRLSRPVLASILISPATAKISRLWHETRRRVTGKRHTVIYYHRVADAWSAVLVQVLGRLVEDYDIDLQIKLVSTLAIDCVPDPGRLDRYAAYDAMRLARAWGLKFPDGGQPAEPALAHLAERIILAQPDNTIDTLVAVTAAVWASDAATLSAMADTAGAVDEAQAETQLALNAHDLRRRGHYQGGTLWFQGEWFWGLDRLYLLEKRLRARQLDRRDQSLASRLFRPVSRETGGSALPLDLEFYFSFRSPYSYLGALRVVALADRLGLNLVLRPVLPMVARGIPVPKRKLRYIIGDVARVARQEKLPFGPICDPLGKGVDNCLAIFHLAKSRGVEREFMLAAMQGIWTRAENLAKREQLQRVAAKAGLSVSDVDDAVSSGNWRAQVEANAASLAVLGMWGVPGMCLRGPDDKPVSIAWGQDRIWVIERAALGLDMAIPPPRLVQ